MRTSIVISLLLLPLSASAYELTGAAWRMVAYPGGVPYCPVVNAKDAVTTTARGAFGAAVDAAMRAWTAAGDPGANVPGIPCSAYLAAKQTCSGSPSAADDQNWIYWVADWASVPGVGPSTIGVTPWWSTAGEILTAKVLFNDRDYTWTTDGSGTDVGSIAVHELGHFVGMNHYDETDPSKEQACTAASYPSVMCSFYNDGIARVPTADDVMGACYLYPQPGAMGSACASGSTCASGVCHPEGYCTQVCPPSCPLGYSCADGKCGRDQPAPACAPCGLLPCGTGSVCMGASGDPICTMDCSTNTDCPLFYFCAAVSSGGGVCWPLGNRCDANGPGPGQLCGGSGRDECALGDVCLRMPAGGDQCFGTCRTRNDCADPAAACLILEAGIGYCDKGSAVCSCDTADGCQATCACDAGCNCTCNLSAACDANCPCDSDCKCACNLTRGCDAGCACDPDCACACDVSADCDPDCDACDPECGGCHCGLLLPMAGQFTALHAVLLAATGVALMGWWRWRRRPLR
ncbi:MAG: hypothetical protein HY903_10020 [Deltaproteobacteria bacterium]|nr:hypothetical protein [Deltaproteobacteria bacterium]